MDVVNMPPIVPEDEREWFVLFAICVAGKSAKQTQKKLNAMLADMKEHTPYSLNCSAFDTVWWQNHLGQLGNYLKKYKMGQYKRIEKAFAEICHVNALTDLSISRLEMIPGIGPKTARFIVLYTNPDAGCAVIDTHVLKFLKKEYPALDVPKSTPSKGRKYKELEELFQHSAKRAGKSVRELDSEVWQFYANK